MKNVTLCVLLVSIGASACRVGETYRAPETKVSERWTEDAVVGGGAVDSNWWKTFGDATLDGLVQRALAGNFDLKIAAARVREARALRASTEGRWDPSVDASGGYTRSKVGTNAGGSGDGHDAYDAGFDARWELDVFGRRDSALEAAQAEIEVTRESRRDATVTLLGEVARNYLELRGIQRQLAITRDNLTAQQDTLRLTRVRFGAGLSTDLDVARAEALTASTRAQMPSLETQARTRIHALSVLLGESPGPLVIELAGAAALPEPPATIAAGLPSELLRRRPDVRRAERELARAAALSNEAVAALYPSFALGASLRQQSDRPRTLLDSDSNVFSFGASFTAPILNGGSLKAEAEAADARVEQARYAYERTVIGALAEVENALVTVSRERERRAMLDAAVQADRRAVALADDLYKRGLASFFEVLTAQQNLLQTESTYAASSTQLAAETVALYKALGGGWDVVE